MVERSRLGVEKLIGGLGEVALEGVDLQAQLCALVDVAAAIDVHIALGVDSVVGQRVIGLVGADDGVTSAQLHMALQAGADVGLALKAIGLHVQRQLGAHRRRTFGLQARAGFELQRRQGCIPGAGWLLCPRRRQGAGQGQHAHGRQGQGVQTDKHGNVERVGAGAAIGKQKGAGTRRERAGRFVESDYP